ncbi:hypothetical protein [uncultured Sphingomonas sp.]|uniref:hypothetical protein n=1 Tax=uncultured Sphingomonas sp. TaxID=158754 RepID=UPI0025D95C35|nr:hypothetical protein [uncultured Sphingomonas sp.]
MNVILYLSLLLSCCLYAGVRGGLPERIGVAILLTAVLASQVMPRIAFQGFKTIETGLLVVDATMFVCVVILALHAQRYWPMWMAAVLLNTVVTHLLMLSPALWPWSYSVANAAWSYPNPIILAIAAWRHRARVQRYGEDPPWNRPLPSGG